MNCVSVNDKKGGSQKQKKTNRTWMSVDVVQLAADVIVAYLGSEVVKRVRRAQSTVSPVVVVRSQAVVSTTLYVERRQVERHVVRQREQPLGQFEVHDLTRPRPLRRKPDQTAHDRVDAALLDETERREEGAMQRQVAGRDRLVGLVEAGDERLNQRVAKAERCAGKLVRSSRVDVRIVAGVRSYQPAHGRVAEQLRQPVTVGDVLNDGADDLACLVVDGVAVPVRVDGEQLAGDAVVFSQPQRVHRQQTKLLIGTVISSLKARHARLTRVHLQTHTSQCATSALSYAVVFQLLHLRTSHLLLVGQPTYLSSVLTPHQPQGSLRSVNQNATLQQQFRAKTCFLPCP